MTLHAPRTLEALVLAAVFAVALSGCSDPGEEIADAVDAGDLAAVKRIATRHPDSVNAFVTNDIGMGESILILAVDDRKCDIARYLISKGARLDVRDSLGQTPLLAAVYGDDIPMTHLLLRAGAPPNARDHDGWMALHQAAVGGSKSLVKLLLARGADPSLKDKSGMTPADCALRNGHADIAKLLKRIE